MILLYSSIHKSLPIFFLGVVTLMLVYPFPARAGILSCDVTSFSQTITAGESVTYKVKVTSLVISSVSKLVLGNLPHGVTGGFVGVDSGFVSLPGEYSLVLSIQRSAQIGTFSLVLLEDSLQQQGTEVICQYGLQILAALPLPTSEPTPEEISVKTPLPELFFGLSFGSRGSDVIKLQALLASQLSLYPEGLVTGWYGPLTTSAVQRFQERVGITPTGKVDMVTQEKLDELREKVPSTSFQFQSYLILGVRGNSVVILQNVLKQLEFFPEDVDSTGYFGSITEVAVQAYQENRGIETTGTVGPITRAALNQE